MVVRFYFLVSLLLNVGIWTSCGSDSRLDKLPQTKLTFAELPDTVKQVYLKMVEPKLLINDDGDTTRQYGVNDTLICFDKASNCRYEIKWFSSFVDEYVFHINDRKLTMEFNSNTINAPYVLYENQFYFIITRNVSNTDDVEKAVYGKFNLTKVLASN